jgi:hypothetical protein
MQDQDKYSVFIKAAFFQAAETLSGDRTPEMDVFFIHHRQAMLRAVQTLQPCADCTARIAFADIKEKARHLQTREYASFPEMNQTFTTQFAELDNLCTSCMEQFHAVLDQHFYILHHRE